MGCRCISPDRDGAFLTSRDNPRPDGAVNAFAADQVAFPVRSAVVFAWDPGLSPATRDNPPPDGAVNAFAADRAAFPVRSAVLFAWGLSPATRDSPSRDGMVDAGRGNCFAGEPC
ncbi:hypothetical protein Afe04nite_83400 [Asanoa ferruginea]|nr:hypothetical protein Afe04nite_83400 [Asanoa ferruginea]